ncbi:hypothetical protein FSP39_007955 [Pinctada imbricata]|uniref:Protein VPRBP n=1 Tax=Pinctada imbricata TaxID=66713 RepID=A0AA88YQC5_PINIB|nr:hypothetical protein FSP39_007955 [Pinctada imbricata]
MTAIDSLTELTGLLEEWSREHNTSSFNVIPVLQRMAELIETETEAYFKMDPDPFDDRHPGRANPTCALGHLMKLLFKNEDFMNKLFSDYMMTSRNDQTDLHIAASRLLLDALPGLEMSIVFHETDGLVRRLFHWAESASDPLRSYATGLLAGALDHQDVANNFKETTSNMVPIMMRRLRELKIQSDKEFEEKMKSEESKRHFSIFSRGKSPRKINESQSESSQTSKSEEILPGPSVNDNDVSAKPEKSPVSKNRRDSSEFKKPDSSVIVENGSVNVNGPASSSREVEEEDSKKAEDSSSKKDVNVKSSGSSTTEKTPERQKEEYRMMRKRALSPSYYSDSFHKLSRRREPSFTENSGSSWAEMQPYVIGTYSLHPLSTEMKQRLILQFLTPMGEYQELISAAFEYNVLEMIYYYIDLRKNTDVRLAFEALKYVATLLCHKKFAIEFLQTGGVQRLLQVLRPSIAATGVSLCLYYLSYFEDAMERHKCLTLWRIVSHYSYTLWLLECSHDSSRCHAALFFSQSFSFRVILDLFDKQDGLRRLLNVISISEIMNTEERREIGDDQLFTMRQLARHVTLALKRYFEAHLAHKVDEIKRSHARSDCTSMIQDTPAYKNLKLNPEIVQENIEIMMELLPLRLHWEPEATFHKLGGISLLCQLIGMAPEWNSYPGKAETIKNALDVLDILVVTPRSQLALLSSVSLPDGMQSSCISILIGLAEGEVLASEPDVQKSALNVIVNCVCGPVERVGGGVGRYMGTGTRKRINWKTGEDVLSKMWNGFRVNNGIMALVGLSRSETVRQIMSKLPLFNNGQIQLLMKEPVLQDRQQDHVRFCKYANDLLERVLGRSSNNTFEASLEGDKKGIFPEFLLRNCLLIRKFEVNLCADIVAQSRITFHEKELLQLIHSHLQAKGLHDTASLLQREANLPATSTSTISHPAIPQVYSSPLTTTTPKGLRQINHTSVHGSLSTPVIPNGANTTVPSTSQVPTRESPVQPGTPGPIRFTINRVPPSPSINNSRSVIGSKSRFVTEKDGLQTSPAWRSKCAKSSPEFNMSLDKIVTEYLRKQHALCRNPVTTCPPMSLFKPHRCPDPRGRNLAPLNFSSRLSHRQLSPPYGGRDGARANRAFIYSRFRPCQTYRNVDDGGYLCCSFSADEQYLILGTYWGDIKFTYIQSGEEAASYPCNSSPISDLQPSKDGRCLLTSYSDIGSAVWSLNDMNTALYNFEDGHIEFSKLNQDRIIGTKDESAHIYDVSTGEEIVKLFDADCANGYRDNRATFNPTDDLVLNDGVLWDIRSAKPVHKFDKFNAFISGLFHPMGLEVIINSEVWDIRTYHLLHTIPALDQCLLHFNNNKDVMYATHMDEDLEVRGKSPYSSTFRTFDATDYSQIGKYNELSKAKQKKLFVSCNPTDRQKSCRL